MTQPIITVEHLSKVYRIGLKEEIPDTLVGAMTGIAKSPFRKFRELRRLNTFGTNGDAEDDTFWALRDVSFEVQEGEVLGIIGRNGAGKSTLLKILSRITEPTSGRAVLRGRVSSLLEVGTGFHPELSGRENVYLNGTVLGMTKREIDRKFDEIIDFSGVEKFLDTPIKRYSSGMTVRLAFSVAAHLEPEILIVDEVLAVGDGEFQKKCLGKMHDVASGGRTVLFVSHNMAAVEGLCTKGVFLDAGRMALHSTAKKAINAYHHRGASAAPGSGHCFHPTNDLRNGHSAFVVRELRISSSGLTRDDGYGVAAPLDFQLSCETTAELRNPVFCIRIHSAAGHIVTEFHSLVSGGQLPKVVTGQFTVTCASPELLLAPGDYTIRICVKESGKWFYVAEDAGRLTVLPTDFFGTGKTVSTREVHFLSRQAWTIKGNN